MPPPQIHSSLHQESSLFVADVDMEDTLDDAFALQESQRNGPSATTRGCTKAPVRFFFSLFSRRIYNFDVQC